MKRIRLFIYLDNYKMYSISSQLFEGLTEYIVKSETANFKETNSQKGNFGTGRLMADIVEKNAQSTEKKFLYDYAYTLFEDALKNEERILEINSQNIQQTISQINDYSFVKITNQILFNDTKIVNDTLSKFNSVGEAFAYITKKKDFDNAKAQADAILKTSKDPREKQSAQNVIKTKFNIKEIAKESGMYLDEEYLKNLALVFNYGYNDQFEVQMPITASDNHFLFSSLLNREMLLEKEESLITKYSRETEKPFTLLGIPTQIQSIKERLSFYEKVIQKFSSGDTNLTIKESVMNIVSHLSNLEATFTGKLPYEYIIDPIAIYREL